MDSAPDVHCCSVVTQSPDSAPIGERRNAAQNHDAAYKAAAWLGVSRVMPDRIGGSR